MDSSLESDVILPSMHQHPPKDTLTDSWREKENQLGTTSEEDFCPLLPSSRDNPKPPKRSLPQVSEKRPDAPCGHSDEENSEPGKKKPKHNSRQDALDGFWKELKSKRGSQSADERPLQNSAGKKKPKPNSPQDALDEFWKELMSKCGSQSADEKPLQNSDPRRSNDLSNRIDELPPTEGNKFCAEYASKQPRSPNHIEEFFKKLISNSKSADARPLPNSDSREDCHQHLKDGCDQTGQLHRKTEPRTDREITSLVNKLSKRSKELSDGTDQLPPAERNEFSAEYRSKLTKSISPTALSENGKKLIAKYAKHSKPNSPISSPLESVHSHGSRGGSAREHAGHGKGKQLVTKNGRVKSKVKGRPAVVSSSSDSSEIVRGIDSCGIRDEGNRTGDLNGYRHDASEEERNVSPVFGRTKHRKERPLSPLNGKVQRLEFRSKASVKSVRSDRVVGEKKSLSSGEERDRSKASVKSVRPDEFRVVGEKKSLSSGEERDSGNNLLVSRTKPDGAESCGNKKTQSVVRRTTDGQRTEGAPSQDSISEHKGGEEIWTNKKFSQDCLHGKSLKSDESRVRQSKHGKNVDRGSSGGISGSDGSRQATSQKKDGRVSNWEKVIPKKQSWDRGSETWSSCMCSHGRGHEESSRNGKDDSESRDGKLGEVPPNMRSSSRSQGAAAAILGNKEGADRKKREKNGEARTPERSGLVSPSSSPRYNRFLKSRRDPVGSSGRRMENDSKSSLSPAVLYLRHHRSNQSTLPSSRSGNGSVTSPMSPPASNRFVEGSDHSERSKRQKTSQRSREAIQTDPPFRDRSWLPAGNERGSRDALRASPQSPDDPTWLPSTDDSAWFLSPENQRRARERSSRSTGASGRQRDTGSSSKRQKARTPGRFSDVSVDSSSLAGNISDRSNRTRESSSSTGRRRIDDLHHSSFGIRQIRSSSGLPENTSTSLVEVQESPSRRESDMDLVSPSRREMDIDLVSPTSTLDLTRSPESSLDESYMLPTSGTESDVRVSDTSDDDLAVIGMSLSAASGRRHRRSGVARPGSRDSVTQIDDDDDDEVLLLEGESWVTPPQQMSRQRIRPTSGNTVTPGTAAAIQQFEADEAMARRLQMEFDQEETDSNIPPVEPPRQFQPYTGMRHFYPHAGPFSHISITTSFPDSTDVSFSLNPEAFNWLHLPPTTRSSRGRRGRSRGRGSMRHHHHEETFPDDYERLLALTEMIGPAVPQGLPADVLSRLPTFKFQSASMGSLSEEDKKCAICMSEYEDKEDLRRLPCFHAYHTRCIDQWFQQNSACPVCRERVSLEDH